MPRGWRPGRHILMVMSARTNATIPLRLSPCCISVAGNQGEGAGPMTSKERRDQGLCVDCGRPALDPAISPDRCLVCYEAHLHKMATGPARTAKQRRALGLCVGCGCPAPVDPMMSPPVAFRKARESGKAVFVFTRTARCDTCFQNHQRKSMAGKAARQAIRDGSRASMARTRAERKASGVCGQCGRHPVAPGRNTCGACLEGANIHHKTLMQQRRDAGQCTRCGVAKDVARYALCGGCREAGRAAQMDRRGRSS